MGESGHLEYKDMAHQKEVMAQSEMRCWLKRSVTIGVDENGDVTNRRWILFYFWCVCVCECVGVEFESAGP